MKTVRAVVIVGSLLSVAACAAQEPSVPAEPRAAAGGPPRVTLARDRGMIAFTSERDGQAEIDVMNDDGSGEQRLADFPVLEPAWSPDGMQIVFGFDDEGFRGIYLMGADGGNLRKLSTHRAGDNCPAWSPDGKRMTFASWRDGDGEIHVMDAGGGNLQKLTDNRSEEEFPAWRPEPGIGKQ